MSEQLAGRALKSGNQRFDWLKHLTRDPALGMAAKVAATILALQICNRQSLLCLASDNDIAEAMGGKSADTARRAVRELEAKGYVTIERGKYRGTPSKFTFLARAEVVTLPVAGAERGANLPPFEGGERGANLPPFGKGERGANLPRKGSKSACAHNIDITKDNQRGADARESGSGSGLGKLSENPMIAQEAEAVVEALRAGSADPLEGAPNWKRSAVINHILAAGWLTQAEVQAAGLV